MKAVVVTGSRHWSDPLPIRTELARHRPHLVVEGGATGADEHARAWAREVGVGRLTWPDEHWGGHVSGPVRNGYMVDVAAALQAAGWDVIVLAFPEQGSRGTWSCVNQARNAGLAVHVFGFGEHGGDT